MACFPGLQELLCWMKPRKESLIVHMDGIHRSAIGELEEAFITSSSRGVLPVQQIDETLFGAPGPITKCLSDRYQVRIGQEIQPI